MEDTAALIDELASKDLDYLHVSVQDFWNGSMRDDNDTTSRVQLVQEQVGDRVPVIGVGSIHTPAEAVQALDQVPLIAIGRELIVEPEWVQKVEDGKLEEIRTSLTPAEQEKLVVPDQLWQAIMNTPGWFPVER